VSQEKYLKHCSSMTSLGHVQVCTPLRPSSILDGQCCHTHPTTLNLHHDIIVCLVLCKKACKDIITPVMRHSKMLCTSGCRGGRATISGWVFLLMFRGGSILSARMDTTLKNNCALSNVVVKFCEISTCPVFK
jgi:hypothetical protein